MKNTENLKEILEREMARRLFLTVYAKGKNPVAVVTADGVGVVVGTQFFKLPAKQSEAIMLKTLDGICERVNTQILNGEDF